MAHPKVARQLPRHLLLFCLALGASGCAAAPPPLDAAAVPRDLQRAAPRDAQIDALMSAYHQHGWFDGSVLVARRGEVVYRGAFGLANREWGVPTTVDARYRIASISKTFTAVLVLRLVELGKVRLDAKLTDYLPDYRKDTGDRVTIHHLLCHTSGIPDYANLPGFWTDHLGNRMDRGELVKNWMSRDLEFAPGTGARYNSSAYFLLGLVIEKVTGRRFEDVLFDLVLSPAGMTRSGYDTPGRVLDKMASGYVETPFGYERARHVEIANVFSGGGMYATVDDLYRWDRALATHKILSPATTETMLKAYAPEPFRKELGFGYGFQVGERKVGSKRVRIAEHGGNVYGFRGLMTRMLDDGHLIVLLENEGSGSWSGEPYAIVAQLMNILYGEPVVMPRPRYLPTLGRLIAERGVREAMARLPGLEGSWSPLSGPNDLNNLGYAYLQRGKVEEAVEILKLNIRKYPDDANSYDTLGEIYMVKGEKALAIENYRRSLSMDPSNQNAVQMLEKLGEPL